MQAKKIRKKPKMLKADDLMPLQEVTWPSEDLKSRKIKSVIPESPAPMDIVKTEPLDVMDVDDLPPPPENLGGFFLVSIKIVYFDYNY